MNLKEFLKTEYSSKKFNIKFTNYNSYTEIQNSFFIGNNFKITVNIDSVLDIFGCCTIHTNSVIMNYPMNICSSMFIDNYKKIIFGTFIGRYIYNDSNKHINYLMINGYVTNNGVLS